jgi:hypothetical protein
MIKINLLPTKRKVSKKISELQQQMVLGGLIFILSSIVVGYVWMDLNEDPGTGQLAERGKKHRGREEAGSG